MSVYFAASVHVGKHIVSPFAKPTAEGAYAASVSIRGGHGVSSHDRVIRFVPQFHDEQMACEYAFEQALLHLNETRPRQGGQHVPG